MASREEFALGSLLGMKHENFKQVVCTTHKGFFLIYNLIKESPILKNKSQCPQMDICQQLALTLERLGCNGNGASVGRLARSYKVSYGSIITSTQRTIEAIYQLGCNYLVWPNEERRGVISNFMSQEGFQGCVGFVDGTTIPLFQRPGLDREVFYDRKSWYSLNVQLVCDQQKHITAILTGWPGSFADGGMYRRMGIYK
ncbi:hypothetical protein O181_035761 [Austropuccinia psidii MF-1]|uniref:DDE Tnp4 domain-containing protein n=1 Tax=Austropuccinia psidii MF-1 TaxID=1389203 RepID=A0A9Q3H994_9BASI|nr:hypothetical protein [Austropuccinia psidii MF-1]